MKKPTTPSSEDTNSANPGPSADLYFRQLLAGRDFAIHTTMAAEMVNFIYLIGDRATGECVVVDPAWDVKGIVDLVEGDGMKLVGALATHFHPDHVGGDLLGMAMVEGIKELLELQGLPIHCQRQEVEWIHKWTGVSPTELTPHDSGEVVSVGSVPIQLIHTPGHTPGSQCFLVADRLISGDTLFLDGCGRTDLPGGDEEEIHRSINERLAHIKDGTVLYPGHLYGRAPSASMGDTRANNYVFKIRGREDWRKFL